MRREQRAGVVFVLVRRYVKRGNEKGRGKERRGKERRGKERRGKERMRDETRH